MTREREEMIANLQKLNVCFCKDCVDRALRQASKKKISREPNDVGGVKFDDAKLRMELLPPRGVEAAARAMTYGAKKYAPRNWEKGIEPDRLMAATLRHLFAVMRDETKDSESGLNHLDHAAASILMLIDTIERRAESAKK